MKPIKLIIDGIKSFSARQEIDFERLSQGGLFGIFGDTASGKSTILSSIMLALYGEDDTRIYQRDFINMDRNDAFISLDFLMNEYSKQVPYRCERSFRIREKSGTYDNKARLLRMDEGGFVVEEDTIAGVNSRIESVIGLSMTEFKKCVILPQGEFASFLRSSPAERLLIIGKLFDLEKYGDVLFSKVREYRAEKEQQILGYEKVLEVIGDFDYGIIDRLKARSKALNAALPENRRQSALISAAAELYRADIELAQQYADAKQTLLSLQSLTTENRQRRQRVDRCQSARAALAEISAFKAAGEAQKQAEQRLTAAQRQADTAKKGFEQATSRYEHLKQLFDGNYMAEAEHIARLKALLPRVEELSAVHKDIAAAAEQYKDISRDLEKHKALLANASVSVNECSGHIESSQKTMEIDARALSRLRDMGYAEGQRDEALHASSYLNEVANGNAESVKYFAARAKIHSKKAEELDNDIKPLSEEERKRLKERIESLKRQMSEAERQRTECEKQAAALGARLLEIAEKGTALKQRRDAMQAEFAKAGMQSAQGLPAAIEQRESKNQTLRRDYEAASAGFESGKAALNASILTLASLSAARESAMREYKQREAAINLTLNKSGFKSIDEADAALLPEQEYTQLKAQTEDFETRLKLAEAQRSKLSRQLDGKRDGGTQYGQLTGAAEALSELALLITQKRARIDGEISELTGRRDKLQNSKRALARLRREYDTAKLLFDLIKARRFMEFVAEEYIQDITLSATAHIRRLSGGRYLLKYERDGFYVADNYCGGTLRKVLTLSGGETFLVSLSLAVALSEAIAKKSDKAMEFFFLDEGFGTLDKELADTVMQTLEQLRQSHFTIGLISHVPELMHRIDYRLMVSAPTESKGSTVKHISP